MAVSIFAPFDDDVLAGEGAPDAELGNEGDFYIDTTPPRTMYGPKTDGEWGEPWPIEVDTEGLARLAGGNQFTGEQKIEVQLPLLDAEAIFGGAEFSVIEGSYRDGVLLRGLIGARMDLSSLGPGLPEDLLSLGVATRDFISGRYIIETFNRDGESLPYRTSKSSWPNLQIVNGFTGAGVLENYRTGRPTNPDDAAPKGYVDNLAAIGGQALVRTLEVPSSSPRFELCSDQDSETWGDHCWTTPAPGVFTTGVAIELTGVMFSTEGLPSNPYDGQQVFSEFGTHPTFPGGVINGDIDCWELARIAVWFALENRWKFAFFWEHTSTTSPTGREDFTFTSDLIVPPMVRMEAFLLWIEFNIGSGKSRGRMFLKAPPGTGDFEDDWVTIGRHVQGVTDIRTSGAPWFLGADYGRVWTEKMTIRDQHPLTGSIMADPDASVAVLAGGGSPFSDTAASPNIWTPSLGAQVVPAA